MVQDRLEPGRSRWRPSVTVFGETARAYFVLNLRTDIRQNAYHANATSTVQYIETYVSHTVRVATTHTNPRNLNLNLKPTTVRF